MCADVLTLGVGSLAPKPKVLIDAGVDTVRIAYASGITQGLRRGRGNTVGTAPQAVAVASRGSSSQSPGASDRASSGDGGGSSNVSMIAEIASLNTDVSVIAQGCSCR